MPILASNSLRKGDVEARITGGRGGIFCMGLESVPVAPMAMLRWINQARLYGALAQQETVGFSVISF